MFKRAREPVVGKSHLRVFCSERIVFALDLSARGPVVDMVRDPSFEEVVSAVRPDSKSRISLGRAQAAQGITYRVYRNKVGQILLDPCLQVPVGEAWLYKNKKALKAVMTGIRQAEEGRTREAGSFAEFADDHA